MRALKPKQKSPDWRCWMCDKRELSDRWFLEPHAIFRIRSIELAGGETLVLDLSLDYALRSCGNAPPFPIFPPPHLACKMQGSTVLLPVETTGTVKDCTERGNGPLPYQMTL